MNGKSTGIIIGSMVAPAKLDIAGGSLTVRQTEGNAFEIYGGMRIREGAGSVIAEATNKHYESIYVEGSDGLVVNGGSLTAKGVNGGIRNADGYDIFFARCNHSHKKIVCRKVKNIKGNNIFTWKKFGLKKGTAYKSCVKAYVYKDGKKKTVFSAGSWIEKELMERRAWDFAYRCAIRRSAAPYSGALTRSLRKASPEPFA